MVGVAVPRTHRLHCLDSGIKPLSKCLPMSWERVRVVTRVPLRSRSERPGVDGKLSPEISVKRRTLLTPFSLMTKSKYQQAHLGQQKTRGHINSEI